jgi:hypothetical protein
MLQEIRTLILDSAGVANAVLPTGEAEYEDDEQDPEFSVIDGGK